MPTNEKLADLKLILKPYVQNQDAFEKIHDNTHFIQDLEINSANLVDVILDVEDKYDIEIDNDSMEQMTNVSQALSVIDLKINEK